MPDLNQFFYKQNRIQQLKGFYYAVREGGVSNAAKKMGLTQAAVTLQIQSLERDLKMTLFKREGKKIVLTEAGQDLYERSTQYVQGIEDLFEHFIKFTHNKKRLIVDIASNHAGISYILPAYIKKFKDEHDKAKFYVRNLSKNDCIKRVLNGEIDMFIYPMNHGEVPEELSFTPIVKYQPILLVNKDHYLAKKEDVTLADIAKFELVRIDPHLITLPAFEELIKVHKLNSSIKFETSDWEILKKFVKANIGVAIISNIVLEGEKDGELVGRILTDYFPEMTYGILIKKGKILNGLAKDFFDLLVKEKMLEIQRNS